jgi:hypothetical protein
MAGAKALLTRVRRIEMMRSPGVSPFGDLDAFETKCQAGIDAGELDERDVPLIILAVRRWHRDQVFAR